MALTFDATYYLTARPDVFQAFVAAGGSNWPQYAEQHFNTYGWAELTNPNATFNTREYLTANPDVAAAGVNPFQHYLAHGVNEGRAPNATFPDRASFDSAAYLAANADLAAAGITTPEAAYAHFVIYGQFEGRPGTPSSNLPATLTTGTDILTANVFEAPLVTDHGIPGNETLNSTDVLTGTGTNPTLNVYASGRSGSPVAATLKGIETINYTDATAAGATLDLSRATGVKALNITALTAGGTPSVRGIKLEEGFKLSLTDSTAGSTFVFEETSAAGDADVLALSVSNSSKVDLSVQGASKIETLNVESKGTVGNSVTTSASVGTQLVNVTGATALGLTTGAAKVDASTFEGKLTVVSTAAAAEVIAGKADDVISVKGGATVDAGDGKDVITVTSKGATTIAAGAGDDTVILRTFLDKTDSLDGGEGADTLVVTAPLGANTLDVKNFETLQIGVTSSGTAAAAVADVAAAGTYDLSKLNGSTITTVALQAAAAGTYIIDKLASGNTVALNGYNEADADDNYGAVNATVNVTDATKAANTADVLNVQLGQLGDSDVGKTFSFGTVTAAGVETINLKSFGAAEAGNILDTLTSSKLTSLVITGDRDLTITKAVVAGVDGASVNASDFTGNLKIIVDGTGTAVAGSTITGFTVTGGSGNDTITGTGDNDLFIGGAGDDILIGGGGVDTFTGGDGKDKFVLGSAVADRTNVTDFTVATDDLVIDLAAGRFALKSIDDAAALANPALTVQTAVSNTDARVAFQSGTAGTIIAGGTHIFELEGALVDGTAAGVVSALGNTATNAALANGDSLLFVTYRAGNVADVWSFVDASNGNVDAAELTLVGTLQGVAANSITPGDFLFY